MGDMVNSPSHYVTGGIECIDVLKAVLNKDEFCGFLRGNAIKYLYRYGKKDNTIQEVKKAQWYVNRLLETLQEKEKEK